MPRGGARPNTGGARPGSGRKKKVVLLAGPIERVKADIEALAPLVGPSLRELVNGIYREEITKEGTIRVYQAPPNIQAVQEVANRILGKMPNPVELPPAPIARPDDGFRTLILGDSAIRGLAQSFFAAMGQSDAVRLGEAGQPISVDTVAPPDVGKRRTTEDRKR